MGSDGRPVPDVAGSVLAAREHKDITLILIGDEPRIADELSKHDVAGLDINIRHAAQEISMTDKPSEVIKGKPESSIHVGIRMVRNGEADAFVTAGNTGAAMGIAMLRRVGLGRIPGVKRPALGAVFPIKTRPFLIDGGANADCRPEQLLQFGIMGSLYIERVAGIPNPRVGLMSNGSEEGKGNALIREAHELLKASDLNFVGNIEPKDFANGDVEVAVTDGFTGNIIIKASEAIASYIKDRLREEIDASKRATVGALFARNAFKAVADDANADVVGGVPLLGVNGVVVIAHGGSSERAIWQAIDKARLAVEHKIVDAIRDGLA